jgi:hypothetical protein
MTDIIHTRSRESEHLEIPQIPQASLSLNLFRETERTCSSSTNLASVCDSLPYLEPRRLQFCASSVEISTRSRISRLDLGSRDSTLGTRNSDRALHLGSRTNLFDLGSRRNNLIDLGRKLRPAEIKLIVRSRISEQFDRSRAQVAPRRDQADSGRERAQSRALLPARPGHECARRRRRAAQGSPPRAGEGARAARRRRRASARARAPRGHPVERRTGPVGARPALGSDPSESRAAVYEARGVHHAP